MHLWCSPIFGHLVDLAVAATECTSVVVITSIFIMLKTTYAHLNNSMCSINRFVPPSILVLPAKQYPLGHLNPPQRDVLIDAVASSTLAELLADVR